jgi:tRNA-dihydrouridine synthase
MNKKSLHNIWSDLVTPFFVLAPLDDVSDTVFRQVVARAAKPDLFFTEFTNVDGYFSPGQASVGRKLRWDSELEQPLIAQIWGKNPENYYKMAGELTQKGFAGIDINMGCPEKSVVKSGNGAGIIGDYARAEAIIKAVQDGSDGKLPVSVKTRIGINTIITEEWASFLLRQGLAALTIHGRTAREMSKVPAHWDEIGKVVKLRNELAPETKVIGNGDVLSRNQGVELAKQWGVDGIMIGRGIFQNIHVFDTQSNSEPKQHSAEELIDILTYHLDLHERTWAGQKHFEPLKKFFKIYVNGFANASAMRAELMECKDYAGARKVIQDWRTRTS